MKDDPRAELKNLLHYLNVEINEGRLDCIEANLEGKFHRAKQGGADQEERHSRVVHSKSEQLPAP